MEEGGEEGLDPDIEAGEGIILDGEGNIIQTFKI